MIVYKITAKKIKTYFCSSPWVALATAASLPATGAAMAAGTATGRATAAP